MKKTLPSLRVGDKVKAEIVECFQDQEVLVNFHGDLIRVRNESRRLFHIGDQLWLKVTASRPLAFQICLESPQLRRYSVEI